MDNSSSPFNYLAVIPPGAPRGNIRSPEVTADRIARHVAVLFGVDVPDNPVGRTWVADYERLRVNEIARGALSGTPEADQPLELNIDLDVIATATLQKYGPDNKAAIVLAGCEILFNSVASVFQDVLGIIGISNDNEPVATPTIFAAWSLLVADTFRAQPALMAAAMQARAVQSKTSLDWRMAQTTRSLAPSERPRELISAEESAIYPQELSILDRTLPQNLHLLGPRYGKDANQETLVKSLINNWIYYILGSADQAFAWISSNPDKPQAHHAEAFLPITEPALTFVSDVLAISPYVQPMQQNVDSSGPGTWEPFRPSAESGDGTHSYQGHTDRLLPRMYSTPEVSRLEPRSQRALLVTHMRMLQLFRLGDDFKSSYLRSRCRQDASQIVQIAKRLWGDADPITIVLAMHSARMELSDLKDTLDLDPALRFSNAIVEGFAAINEAWRSGVVPDHVWIGLVYQCSADFRVAIDYIEKSDKQQATSLGKTHWEYWRSATEDTGMKEAWHFVFSDSPDKLPLNSVHGLLQNYLGLPFRSSDPEVLRSTLKFSLNKLLPLRRRVSESRRSENAYRFTLQITVRALFNLLGQGTSLVDEAWLVETAEDLESQLLESALGQHFFEKSTRNHRDSNQSDLNYLGSLARVQVSILEHRNHSRKPFDQVLRRTANTIRTSWETFAEVLKQEIPQPGANVTASPYTRRYSEFTEYESRVREIAKIERESAARETMEYVASQLSRAEEVRLAVQPAPSTSQRG